MSILTPPSHRHVGIVSLSTLLDNQSGFLDYVAVDALGVAPSPTPTPTPVAPVVVVDGVTANSITTVSGVPATSDVAGPLAVSTFTPRASPLDSLPMTSPSLDHSFVCPTLTLPIDRMKFCRRIADPFVALPRRYSNKGHVYKRVPTVPEPR